MKIVPSKKRLACKKASESLAFACDAVDDYLNEFPNCETKPALMRLTRDMNDLSLYIQRKPVTWKKYAL